MLCCRRLRMAVKALGWSYHQNDERGSIAYCATAATRRFRITVLMEQLPTGYGAGTVVQKPGT